MREIINYIRRYFYEADKITLIIITLFTALLVYINYNFGLDPYIRKKSFFPVKLFSWYLVFLAAFGISYLVIFFRKKFSHTNKTGFLSLVLIAPLLFALKITLDISFSFSENENWNSYWNHVVYWPVLVILILSLIYLFWKIFETDTPFYGISTKNINRKPYLLMLLIMMPLVAAASTQADFLAAYPKLKLINDVYHEEGLHWWHKLLFELAYGSDFITIEFFFRGFLVLAFLKWAGKEAILPMACFYCTIHFGKPLGECISSYFGGMLLGIVVYNTRSVWGGLMVHLGIAWLMELGGYIGNSFAGNQIVH
ncbi:MAG TPA: hypothetical protein PKC72_13770 [Chitinophagaceae bacterium]|nr:hypothetical protein [Chitinophagaceae bacterium]